jgi:O-antigen ligase
LGCILALVGTWRQEYHKIIHRPLNWGLAILASLLVITAGFAFDRSTALLGLFNFLPFFGFFAAFSVLIQTPAQLRQLAWILVVTSVPVVIVGLGQLFLGWVSPVQLEVVLGWVIVPKGNPLGRMASVFMYANVLAGYLVIVFILGLGLWIETYQEARTVQRSGRVEGTRGLGDRGTRRTRENLQQSSPLSPPYPQLPCLFLSVAVIGNLVALILTNSRNAWVIAVCASLAFALYQGWRWLVAGVVGVAGSVLLAAFGPSPLQQWLRAVVPAFFWVRLTDQLYPDRPLVLLRTTQWQFAWVLTQQRPWTGWGLRNFTPLYEAQMHVWLGHPHNFLLMLTAETGIPFAVLFCGWVSWVVVQGVNLLRNWLSVSAKGRRRLAQDKLIFFSYLVAFLACMLFNTVDVSLFDLRLNLLGWLLLSAISGVKYHRSVG